MGGECIVMETTAVMDGDHQLDRYMPEESDAAAVGTWGPCRAVFSLSRGVSFFLDY